MNPETGQFENLSNFGWVNYTSHIRPVCLPCMESKCLKNVLTRQGILRGNETSEERCALERKFSLLYRYVLDQLKISFSK